MSRRGGFLVAAVFAAVFAGCASSRAMEFDAQHPAVRISEQGFLIGEEFVEPVEIPEILEDSGVPKDATIHILIDEGMERDLRAASAFMAYLAKCGYTRPMLVTRRHAEAMTVKPSRRFGGASARPPAVRYKRSDE